METGTKKSAVKTVLTIAVSIVVAMAIVKGFEFGVKKLTKKSVPA